MFTIRPYNGRNNLSIYNPFKAMEELERDLFESPFSSLDRSLAEFKTDIKDNGDSYLLEADLPGFAKEDIKLELSGDYLTISAERHSEHEQKDKQGKYIRCERSYGSYCRSFNVSGIKSDAISAKYENGVLKLTLPKLPEQAPGSRRLEIE